MNEARELLDFVKGSPTALMQLLVAASSKDVFARIVDCPTYPIAARTPDLPAALEALCSVLDANPSPAEVFAKLYETAYSVQRRKDKGQFFTPAAVASFVLANAGDVDCTTICDAGAGTGALVEALIRAQWSCDAYVGIENDPLLALMTAHVLTKLKAPRSFQVWYTNFLTVSVDDFLARDLQPPTAIISNPPYVRFHNLRDRERVLGRLSGGSGVRLSALSGSANYFVGKGIDLLRDQTRAATGSEAMLFLMPKEADGGAHYRRFREILQNEIGWAACSIEVPLETLRDDSGAIALLFKFRRAATRELTGNDGSSARIGVHQLREIATVRRGLSTGKNSFFVLADAEARLRDIPEMYLRPVLPTKISFDSDQFTTDDWLALRDSGYPCWVLSIPSNAEIEDLEPSVRAYLKEGLQQGIHGTATARQLKRWYALPISNAPPAIFVTYFFRGTPRFILNAARVVHLTNILGIRLRDGIWDSNRAAQLVQALNSDARLWFQDRAPGREYRDGLRKIEPKELERLPISAATAKIGGLEYGGLMVPTLFD